MNKIKVACEARRNDDFLIVARTDSRTSLGLAEALDRAHAFAEAGADVLFIEAPETTEEMKKIGESFTKPLLINIVEGGKTPVHSQAELEKMGFKIAIHPATAFLAVGQVLEQVYGTLLKEGSSQTVLNKLYDFKKFSELMGFEEVWDFDRKHADW